MRDLLIGAHLLGLCQGFLAAVRLDTRLLLGRVAQPAPQALWTIRTDFALIVLSGVGLVMVDPILLSSPEDLGQIRNHTPRGYEWPRSGALASPRS